MQFEEILALSNWERSLVAAIYRDDLPLESGMFSPEITNRIEAALMVLESLPEPWALAILNEQERLLERSISDANK